MSDEFADYPKGRVSIEGGDLVDVYDINLAFTDGEKTVSTLRQNPAGSTGGARSVSATMKSAISESGFERDYWNHYRRRKVIQMRLKVPGKTFVLTGRYTTPGLTSNVDNFTDFSIQLIGKSQEVNG